MEQRERDSVSSVIMLGGVKTKLVQKRYNMKLLVTLLWALVLGYVMTTIISMSEDNRPPF